MLKWAYSAVASVTGAQEPEYGTEAFTPIDESVKGGNPYGSLTKADYEWQQPAQSHVETQTFYFGNLEYYGFAQLIHSNPVNLAFTSQFTFLLRKHSDPNFNVWTSQHLDNGEAKGVNFHADGFDVVLSEDENEYKFVSVASEETQCELRIKRVSDGFKIGKDGLSRYGTDPSVPWGSMRHIFWPRCSVEGRIITNHGESTINLKSADTLGMYVMALQNMKPHHLAKSWNFLNFQGPTVSAVVMEFVTPGSYGFGRSSVGGVVKDGKLISTAVGVDIEHQDKEEDSVGWTYPKAISFSLSGPDPSGEGQVKTTVSGKINLVERLDVMAEIPAFVKRVASGLSGARPFIYQYSSELEARVTDASGNEHVEKGWAFSEATFIS